MLLFFRICTQWGTDGTPKGHRQDINQTPTRHRRDTDKTLGSTRSWPGRTGEPTPAELAELGPAGVKRSLDRPPGGNGSRKPRWGLMECSLRLQCRKIRNQLVKPTSIDQNVKLTASTQENSTDGCCPHQCPSTLRASSTKWPSLSALTRWSSPQH